MKKYLIFFGIYILSFNFLFSQTVRQTEFFADSLYASGSFDAALHAYNRAFYFSDDSGKCEISKHISEIYLLKGNFSEAHAFGDSMLFYAVGDSLGVEACFLRVKIFILSRDFVSAKKYLDNCVCEFSADEIREKNFLYGTIFFGLNNYAVSQEYFCKLLNDTGLYSDNDLSLIFTDTAAIKLRPDRFPKLLSAFLPGSGMIVSGDYANGLNSAVLNGSLVLLIVNSSIKLSVFDGMLAFFPWFWRYYISNLRKTERISVSRNMQKKSDIYNRILFLLEETQNK